MARAIRETGLSGKRILPLDSELANWLEWERVPVAVDMRPEIWEPAISGSPGHGWRDWADDVSSPAAIGRAVDSGRWDAVLATEEDRGRLPAGLVEVASAGGASLWVPAGAVG